MTMSFQHADGGPSFFLVLCFDDFCLLLSGAFWDVACAGWSVKDLTAEQRRQLPLLAARFTHDPQFHFEDSMGALSH